MRVVTCDVCGVLESEKNRVTRFNSDGVDMCDKCADELEQERTNAWKRIREEVLTTFVIKHAKEKEVNERKRAKK